MKLSLILAVVIAASTASAGVDDVLSVSSEDGNATFSRSAARFEVVAVEGTVVRRGERQPYSWTGRLADGMVTVDGDLQVNRVDVDWYTQFLPVDERFGRRATGPGVERFSRPAEPPQDQDTPHEEPDEDARRPLTTSTVTDWNDGSSERAGSRPYYMFASERRAAAAEAERRAEQRRFAAEARRHRAREKPRTCHHHPHLARPATAAVRYNTGSAYVDSLTVHRFGGNLRMAECHAIATRRIR